MHIPDSFILQLNLLTIIVLLTIVCSLLLRKNNVKANIFLAMLVFYPVSAISLNVIALFLKKPELIFLNSVNASINFTFGPVLLMYLYLLQGKGIKKVVNNPWHFVLSVLCLFSTLYYVFIPYEEKVVLMNKMHAGEEHVMNTIAFLSLIHFSYYMYAGWRSVAVYKEKAIDLGVYETEISVKWQREFLLCLISLNVLIIFVYILPMLLTGRAHIYTDMIAVPALSLFMYVFLIYKGLSYHVIFNKPAYKTFTEAVAPLNNFIDEVETLEKRQTANRDEFSTENDNLKIRLEQLFSIEKIHTRIGLKMYDVAGILNVRPAVLSAFINTHLKMTFFEMLNRYRIEEAKQMLIHEDYQRYKVEYIAEMSGFNSRASFFRVFKKQLGKTPQDFRDAYFLKGEKSVKLQEK